MITSLAPVGWQPSPIEQWLLSAVARIGVENVVLAGRVPLEIFMYFGESVLNVPALQATNAVGSVTFTTIDADGPYTIVAGAQLDVDGVAFTTDIDLVIENGDTTGTVTVTSVDVGDETSGLVGTSVELLSPTLLFVSSVALDGLTTDGTDGETGEEYADRLADELPTLSEKAILLSDFATLARRNPAVGRALAIDHYNPTGPDPAAEGHVTIAVTDTLGGVLSGGTKDDIAAELSDDDNRVLNLVVHVIDPAFTTVDVAFTATMYDDWDAVTVAADAVAAVEAFLDPGAWGRPTFGSGTDWIDETTLRRNDLIGVLYGVPGIRHVTALTLARVRTVTGVAATDVLTSTSHGYTDTTPVVFDALAGGAPLVNGTTYYVRDSTTNTFKVAATSGGAAINVTTDITSGTIRSLQSGDVTLTGPASLPLVGDVSATVT